MTIHDEYYGLMNPFMLGIPTTGLSIGVIACNKENTQNLLKQIIKNENSYVKMLSDNKAELIDGTTYYVISQDMNITHGKRLNQVIVDCNVDTESDFFWCIKAIMDGSCVPEEFLIQYWR